MYVYAHACTGHCILCRLPVVRVCCGYCFSVIKKHPVACYSVTGIELRNNVHLHTHTNSLFNGAFNFSVCVYVCVCGYMFVCMSVYMYMNTVFVGYDNCSFDCDFEAAAAWRFRQLT